MPINYREYHPDWKSKIRPAILRRAKNCCEFCGLPNYSEGYRKKDGKFLDCVEVKAALHNAGYDYFRNELKHYAKKDDIVRRPTKIMLAVAHLDHDIQNNDFGNLRALCQRCHLQHDNDQHRAKFRRTIAAKKGLLLLF